MGKNKRYNEIVYRPYLVIGKMLRTSSSGNRLAQVESDAYPWVIDVSTGSSRIDQINQTLRRQQREMSARREELDREKEALERV